MTFATALLFLPILLFSGTGLLEDANALAEKYSAEIAKAPPPSQLPKTIASLDYSVWLSLDLNTIEGTRPLEQVGEESFLSLVKEAGFDALYLEHLNDPRQFEVEPCWGNMAKLKGALQDWNLALVGDTTGSSTRFGADFEFALQNIGEYPSLFHLVEIERGDWNLLPEVPVNQVVANVPWLTLQTLHQKGYVPESYSPYVKESSWNATMKIHCKDGNVRRWIYLKEGSKDPVFSWLSPSFGAGRIAAASVLNGLYNLDQKILTIDGKLPAFAKETLSLWIRKMGAFSLENMENGLLSLKAGTGDLLADTLTQRALLHALIAEDAEALQMIYRIFLENKIEIRRLLHQLQPFDKFACSWSEFLLEPRKKYQYRQEQITAEILKDRLLKEDLYRLGKPDANYIAPSTWVGYCKEALGIQDVEERTKQIQKAHLLLALTYAMQPGALSISLSDLLGVLPKGADAIDLLGPNADALYPSLPTQARSQGSFVQELSKILEIRRNWSLAKGEVVAVPQTDNRGTLVLIQKLYGTDMFLALAVNFSRVEARETIQSKGFENSYAIELLSERNAEKSFESPHFSFSLSPLSGKVFLFQKKNYGQ